MQYSKIFMRDNKIRQSNNYIIILIILFSMFFLRDYKVLGLSVFLAFQLLLSILLLFSNLFDIKSNISWIKKKIRQEWMFLVVFLWIILRLIISFFSTYLGATLDRNFIILVILSCILSVIFYGKRSTYGENWLEAITISGGIGTAIILLCMLDVPYVISFVMIGDWYWESIASYLLLPVFSSAVLFCTTENRKKQLLAFGVSLLSFFVLFLNENQTGIWMVVFFFLGIPMLFRPRAELIKRSMQLLFTFLFLWCNMSLITNYVKAITWPPVTYSLEASVYGELILAVAALLFFHFWDHIPEGKNLNFVSMIGMQKIIRSCFIGLLLFLGGGIVNIQRLASLPQEGFTKFIVTLLQPLAQELQSKHTSFFVLYQNTGILITVLVLAMLIILGKKIYAKIHKDKIWTNYLFLFYLLFMAQFFLLDIADQVVLVNILLLLWGLTIEESPLNIKAIKMEVQKKIEPVAVKECGEKKEEIAEETTNEQSGESDSDEVEEKQSLWKRLWKKKPEELKEEPILNPEAEGKEEIATEKKEDNAMESGGNPTLPKKEEKTHFFKRKRKEETGEDEFLNSNIVEERREQTKEEILSLEEELKQALEQYEKSQSESSKKFEQLMRKEKRGVEK